MKKYIHAISVVAQTRDNILNNRLYTGIADLDTTIAYLRDIEKNYDSNFSNDIVLINCNIFEEGNPANAHQFNYGYQGENLTKCIEQIIADIKIKLG